MDCSLKVYDYHGVVVIKSFVNVGFNSIFSIAFIFIKGRRIFGVHDKAFGNLGILSMLKTGKLS